MPELPEVETVCRGITAHALGQTIYKVVVRNRNLRWPVPAALKTEAAGQRVANISRRGKYILIATEKGTVLIHLGMSGVLSVIDTGTRLKKHDHVDLVLDNHKILRLNDPRRFGCVLWETGDVQQHKLLVHLGPEPLSQGFCGRYLHHKLQGKKTAIKTAIMDSKLVVGVGNIYASEALFHSRILPERVAGSISREECNALAKAIKQVLRSAIKAGGSSIKDFSGADGKPGYFAQTLTVYGRKGQPCVACGQAISQQTISQRASYFCRQCQR